MSFRGKYREYPRNDAGTGCKLILTGLVETKGSDGIRNGLDNLDGKSVNKIQEQYRRHTSITGSTPISMAL